MEKILWVAQVSSEPLDIRLQSINVIEELQALPLYITCFKNRHCFIFFAETPRSARDFATYTQLKAINIPPY
jgi:hypothetical protein